MDTTLLTLTLNTRIYERGNFFGYENFSGMSMYTVMKHYHKAVNGKDNSNKKYDILLDTSDLLIASVTENSNLKFISANNNICALIVNFGKDLTLDYNENYNENYMNSLLYRLSVTFCMGELQSNIIVNHMEVWEEFLSNLFNIVLSHNSHEWIHIDINERIPKSKRYYKLIYMGNFVEVYGGLDSSNNVLIGFCLNNNYNYFTNKYKITKKINNKNKIRLLTNTGTYTFSNNKDESDRLKFVIELCNNDTEYYKHKDLEWIVVDNMIIDLKDGEIEIAFREEIKHKIQIILSSNKALNCDELLDKMSTKQFKDKQKMLGEDDTVIRLDNITLYEKIPANRRTIYNKYFDYIITINNNGR